MLGVALGQRHGQEDKGGVGDEQPKVGHESRHVELGQQVVELQLLVVLTRAVGNRREH